MEPSDPTHGNTLWGGDLSNLTPIPDGDTDEIKQKIEAYYVEEPEPEPSWWWKAFWWPLTIIRRRTH